ncbi:MAG: sugar ABC transporter ATP-binding protein [Thermoflexales bacterium]|nr:sugar ABC transporter ATP-binding protein [Thermoflexales bacterium]MCS7324038.1 sugar ABC transporter ATP-binding protein [Thermoflexales bacterium]MCX7938943.1 sugar ABC transporter ATP-binding protein [Thermoflexales bacterium]MDW8053996.1 sugar ABC transporter ATP-binding protein [Anaerolineae bacterium]MDW8293150.1 sugar ABC transporter ATP-binding protein [Anaerolineae bacterium]
MAPPIIELREISKSFPGVQALDRVSFEVREGEVHALLGENGAGKSTLIKILTGAHQPDSGTILLRGQPITIPDTRHGLKLGIAAIYQELSLYPDLSVAENIFMGHQPSNRFGVVSWRQMQQRARAILHELDADDLDVSRPVRGLSVGNQQRVEIAKALSHDARILIMDEPTAALTQHDVDRLFEIVRRLRARGVAIIYITHRLEEVFLLADRVTVLRDGRVVGETMHVSQTNQAELVRMMVGRTLDTFFPKDAAEPGEVVLEARNLSYGRTTRNVSFVLRRGEIVGLAGLVGAGRSELAQVLFGITPAESGEIRVEGKPVRIRNPREAMALGIAYVPEDRKLQGLLLRMNVRENTTLAVLRQLLRYGFVDDAAEMRLTQEYVDRLQIRTPSQMQQVANLSGGNQQKVVLAKWLAAKPKVLILDEPTRGIDVGAKAEIHRLMNTLAQQGMAILMISSELPEVLGMSDRVLVMRQGTIVAEFDRAHATQEAVIAAAMGADALHTTPAASTTLT